MPLNLYSVQQSQIWQDMIEKEDMARLLWYERAKKGDMTGESMRFEVFKKQLERNAIKPLNVRKLPPIDKTKHCTKSLKAFQRSLDKTATDRALGKSANQRIFNMYPVDSRIRDKLYDGFAKEGKGRRQYLDERHDVMPEKKYQFPLCSSWEYGWHQEDYIPKSSIRNPVYGRRAIVESDFFTRNELPQYHRNRHLKPDDARAYILMAE